MHKLYKLDDSKRTPGVYEVNEAEAREANSKGWGIFHTFNDFDGARKKENLVKINAWAVDIDDGTKEEQMAIINNAPYKPTKIIESKNGYHVYYYAENATEENYTEIITRVIYNLKGDRCAKDVTRLLRAPGYFHCKDIDNKFMVKEVYRSGLIYTEAEMLRSFKPEPQKKKNKGGYKKTKEDFFKPEKWEILFKVSNIGTGNRNHELARIALWIKDEGIDMYGSLDILLGVNQMLSDPLPESEVRTIVRTKF